MTTTSPLSATTKDHANTTTAGPADARGKRMDDVFTIGFLALMVIGGLALLVKLMVSN